ncbi:MAG TPA: hypothetical protein VM925_10940 [Labilithrix sp.]|jgi:hypothetical protein|nr:hypothetical protein [Labilithrix sp.]
MRARACASISTALLLAAQVVHADEPAPSDTQAPAAAQVDLTKDTKAPAADDVNAPPPEAPPAAPYKKTLVLDSSIGAIGFLGEFGKVAPPGPWMHVQLGYELLQWLMVYGEGELAFTDTSNKLDPPNTRAFAMFGFGGGARFTIRFTDRFGIYAQGGLGMLKADVPTNALGILGFRDAESLDVYLGARLGVEWFQIDRHFALGVNAGIRTAQGFAKIGAGTDTPLALDGGLSLRYAF